MTAYIVILTKDLEIKLLSRRKIKVIKIKNKIGFKFMRCNKQRQILINPEKWRQYCIIQLLKGASLVGMDVCVACSNEYEPDSNQIKIALRMNILSDF